MPNCAKCGNKFKGKNYGRVINGLVLDLCSTDCRQADAAAIQGGGSGAGTPEGQAEKQKTLKKPAKPKIGQISEAQISKAIGENLTLNRVWNTRLQSGALKLATGHFMRLCPEGTPDRLAAPGLMVFFEIKKPGREPDPAQLETAATLRKNGAMVFFVDSIDDYLSIMAAIKKRAGEFAIIAGQVRKLQADIAADVVASLKGRLY